MDTQQIIRNIKNKFHSKNVLVFPSREARVLMHWKIVSAAFLVAVILLFISNFFIYREINKGEFFAKGKQNYEAAKLSVKLLDSVVKYFDIKEDTYTYVKSSSVTVADPSK